MLLKNRIVRFKKINIQTFTMQTLPVYLTYIKRNDLAHISIGVDINTLCNQDTIVSAAQSEKPEEYSENEICDECLEKFKTAINYIQVEPIIRCDRCSYKYSSYEARCVDSMTENKVPVCKPCYEELVESDKSGVQTEYNEAEPWRDNNSNRKFDIYEELKNEFEEITKKFN